MRSKARARKLAKSRCSAAPPPPPPPPRVLFVCSFYRRSAFPPPPPPAPKLQRVSRVPPRPCHFVKSSREERARVFVVRGHKLSSGRVTRSAPLRFPRVRRSLASPRFPASQTFMRDDQAPAGALPDYAPADTRSPPSEYLSSL